MNRDMIHNLKSELAEEKPQFDCSLGGSELIASTVNYRAFAEHRIREITALSQAIEEPQHTTLIFQELPRHMRRRVMGHTSKRLPRMLREAHHNQLVKGSLIQPKKPNRKRKRRSANLLQEFNRRQRAFVWLETHMWHAKRFHMVDKWGYKIADFPNDKSFRACYRASSKHCLLQDVSYLCCVELIGPLGSLLRGLSDHARAECGPTFAARAFLSGAREGNVTLFHRGTYPYGAIGHVNFLWKPPDGDASQSRDDPAEVRTLWIWVHPASYPELLEELVRTFDLEARDNQDDQEETLPAQESKRSKGTEKKTVEKTKLEVRNVPYVRTPKYENRTGVVMVLLKDTLNRLRLTGPLSQAVLAEALCIARCKRKRLVVKEAVAKQTPASDIDEIFALMSEPVARPASESDDDDAETEESNERDWWSGFYGSRRSCAAAMEAKRRFWKSVTEKHSPAELPPNLVVGLTVVDPRLGMPAKRRKAVPHDRRLSDQPLLPAVLTPPPEAGPSAIWSPAVRDVVSQTKLDVAELNSRRKRLLVPGLLEEDEEEVSTSNQHSRIPVLLLQRPGCRDSRAQRIGFGSGWDVVVPAGWAMPLWMALVFRGARPGGQREAAGLRREMSDVDILVPDSMPGRRESDARREELTEKHFRLPPAKRPNYIKLGISSPFCCAWDTLTHEWASPAQTQGCARNECCAVSTLGPYFVLRDRDMLSALQTGVEVPSDHRNCLVAVSLTMKLRGTPDDFSLICVPTGEDLGLLGRDPRYLGPEEPQHADDNEERRKTLRRDHQALMKRMRKQRVRATKRIKDLGVVFESVPELTSKERRKRLHQPCSSEVADQHRTMDRHLWLPYGLPVKDRCSRLTMGFVTHGGFSFARAGGAGVGYVPLPALVDLMAKQPRDSARRPLYVLVRNPTTYQYQFATLGVIAPV